MLANASRQKKKMQVENMRKKTKLTLISKNLIEHLENSRKQTTKNKLNQKHGWAQSQHSEIKSPHKYIKTYNQKTLWKKILSTKAGKINK